MIRGMRITLTTTLLAAALLSVSAPASAAKPKPLPAQGGNVQVSDTIALDASPTHDTNYPGDPRKFLSTMRQFWEHPDRPQDIPPRLFADFWLKWEMVTTRFKPDGQELRFVYANQLGAYALADDVPPNDVKPFPTGTVFAKIGAGAVHDTLFDNSLVPGDIHRIQVMWKNPADANARDGWVYSLYLPGGRTMGHLTNDEIEACHACHVLAKSRDMVFSVPFPGSEGAVPARLQPLDGSTNFKQTFTETGLDMLSPQELHILMEQRPDTKKIYLRRMPAFDGTVAEAREVLAAFARDSQMPFVLANKDSSHVLLAVPDTLGLCATLTSIDRYADVLNSNASPTPHFKKSELCRDDKPGTKK